MTEKRTAWHTLSGDQALAALEATQAGLDENEVEKRRSIFGENALLERRRISLLSVFFDQFRNFMVIVLLIATLISGLLGEYTDALTIMSIVLANGVLGFFQQVRAEKSLASLKQLTAPEARVMRNRAVSQVLATALVPGDIVLLEAGDRVPADCRLLSARELAVEESSLTGESVPVQKDERSIATPDAPLGDRAGMVFMGTMVTRGKASAVVVETGMGTEMGRIAELIQTSGSTLTPLEHRLNQLGRILVWLSLAITIIVVIAGVLHGHALYEMFLAGVSLAVAAIPEGLPAIVTIALALGVSRMIERKAIVRRLPSVETLGCATVICSDKTGTLTQNQMTVKRIWLEGVAYQVAGEGYQASGQILRTDGLRIDQNALLRLADVARVCNNAAWRVTEGHVHVSGDPTEVALLVLAEKIGGTSSVQRVNEYPFDSERKRMSVIASDGTRSVAYVKGAPDVLLSLCTHLMMNGKRHPLTPALREKIGGALAEMARDALRTIALATREVPNDSVSQERVERDLTFVGLVGMMDPPREEVAAAIVECKRAGIKTIMITGDHRLTAEAVAARLGILPQGGRVMTGAELDQLTERELEDAVNQVYVFARVSPQHKLRIVKALQKRGHVVAMTGDGVNDAPAIKSADIGIAMGKSGTDVAKDASSLVLADDNFATIVAAIEEGRNIYDNIRKFIRYLLTSNVGEILTMFFAMMMGLPLPLLPIQILWVNLVTDGLPAIALGVDSPEPGTMMRPPRAMREGIFARGLGRQIITRGIAIGVVTLSVFALSLHLGVLLKTAQTMAFATLVMAQLILVFDCRSVSHGIRERGIFGNPYLVAAVAISFVMLWIVMYLPTLQPIFKTAPLSLAQWGGVLFAAALPTLSVGAKRARRRHATREGTHHKAA
ncbi:calcium-translocating P-type ATPase, SERCA-type [Ferroacidibacillus organovorans]|uniref:P-type Ca(2+) transporter n=1 Tax=Ferroacidibacillus organovorans TaxID=1765683 RepID=A0A101XQF2_9BACL|nr:calcium-translocating P-type ATPase, SERCA-type [Ferroacidibacillus organovorans]KUO95589.1 ATPase [Ferroacidibacillus organovorans]